MAQRLSRARATLRAAGARFELPAPAALPERVAAVLDVLHLAFNEGYTRSAGDTLVDGALTARGHPPDARAARGAFPATTRPPGALALMLLTRAREAARTDARGDLVPLSEQDRRRWDAALIAEGVGILERVLPRGPVGRYQLQAAIAAVHAEAADVGGHRLAADRRALRDARARAPGPGGHAQPRRRRRHDARRRARPGDRRSACSPTRRCAATTAPTPSARTCSRWPATATAAARLRARRAADGEPARAALPQRAGGRGQPTAASASARVGIQRQQARPRR